MDMLFAQILKKSAVAFHAIYFFTVIFVLSSREALLIKSDSKIIPPGHIKIHREVHKRGGNLDHPAINFSTLAPLSHGHT